MIVVGTAAASCVTRVTTSEAPAITTTRKGLGLHFVAMSLASYRLLGVTLVDVVETTVQVFGTVFIAVTHPVFELLGFW